MRSNDSSWILLDGWSDNGTYYTQRVTSESKGDINCSSMQPIASEGGRQHYVLWNIPSTAYCLDASGTIKEEVSGKIVNFRHVQVWLPSQTCPANPYQTNKVCIRQYERWWDDNNATKTMKMTLKRDLYTAKGLGMAYKTIVYEPTDAYHKVTWQANGRNYWTWQ